MVSSKRGMRHLGSTIDLGSSETNAVYSTPLAPSEPPQVNLPHVDTQLNMHQLNGLFEDGSPAADGLRGRSIPIPASMSLPILRAQLTGPGLSPTADSHGSPTELSNPSASPNLTAEETQTEWSAVGHAATGKSGRVIHGLQEEIARLRRDCGVYRSRAEETQRSNETLKTQTQNMAERLRNLEQVNETNLNSIARKDRKIEELRSELQSERDKRKLAEASASKTNDMMRDERETHHREQAETQELAKYHQTQYDVLASSTKREKTDLNRRVKTLFDELKVLKDAYETHSLSTDHLEVIADQKNREVEGLKDAYEKLMNSHVEYKKIKDDELRDELERSRTNNDLIETSLASLNEAEVDMKWAVRLHNEREEKKAKKGTE